MFAGFLLLTLLCAPVQWIAVKARFPARRTIPKFYHRSLCKMIGIRVRVFGEPLTSGGLLLANHSSWLDIIILSSICPFTFVAKSEVNSWPLFGFLARLQSTIFVRRGEKSRTLSDREIIRNRIDSGEEIVIFPEGTSSDGNRVLPFKSALLSAAELPLHDEQGPDSETKVQPVSIAYVANYGIPMGREIRPSYAWYGDMDLLPHLWGAFAAGPLDVVVEFHEPLTSVAAGGRKKLADRAECAVRAGLMRALNGGAEHSKIFTDSSKNEASDDAVVAEAAQ
nr:MAG: 1-acyl-sn-glycerol-3-phosphate acyltransferase [Hyphomicrobiales bacterium]